jgi:signal transduction histidine kinase
VTATIGARQALSCTVRYAPGRGQRREAEEWQLVSDASHELRTPLTALRTEVELALLGNRDASELRAALPPRQLARGCAAPALRGETDPPRAG